MFEINSKVVCVDDRFPAGINDIFNALPRKGTIYTVRDIVPAQDWKLQGTCAVLIVELVNRPNMHGIEPGFQCHRFREPTQDELEATQTESKAIALSNCATAAPSVAIQQCDHSGKRQPHA